MLKSRSQTTPIHRGAARMPIETPGQMAIAQQALLAEFGRQAGSRHSLDDLLARACAMVADSLGVSFVKVLQWLPDENQFVVKAGHGWDEGVVGTARVGADLESPAGYAIRSDKPVITNDLENEDRFRMPALLRDHGVKSAVNVIIQTADTIFGVFEADSRGRRDFTERDTKFLQGAANLLGLAIERHSLSEQSTHLARQNAVLLNEIRHRSANNLQMIADLIHLQRSETKSPEGLVGFEKLTARISALSVINEQLAPLSGSDLVDLAVYMGSLIGNLLRLNNTDSAPIKLKSDVNTSMVDQQHALYIGLIANEFILNAVKHAFRDGEGTLSIAVSQSASATEVVLSDDGPGFDRQVLNRPEAQGSGLMIIGLLAEQMGATSDWTTATATTLKLSIPRQAAG